jgi:beta-galactosidase beta subunit
MSQALLYLSMCPLCVFVSPISCLLTLILALNGAIDGVKKRVFVALVCILELGILAAVAYFFILFARYVGFLQLAAAKVLYYISLMTCGRFRYALCSSFETVRVDPLTEIRILEPVEPVQFIESVPIKEELRLTEPIQPVRDVQFIESVPIKEELRLTEPIQLIRDIQFIESVPIKEELRLNEPIQLIRDVQFIESVPIKEELRLNEPIQLIRDVQFIESVPIKEELRLTEPIQLIRDVQFIESLPIKEELQLTEPIQPVRDVQFIEPIKYEVAKQQN